MSEPPKSRLGPRFSLLSMFLTITLACLSIAHYMRTEEAAALEEENRRLRMELGEMTIGDPDKVYARQLATADPMVRKCRVYLPPDGDFSLQVAFGWPKLTFPQDRPRGPSRQLPRGEQFTLTVIFSFEDGAWKYMIYYPTVGHGSSSPTYDFSWLKHSSTIPPHMPQRERTADGPIEILRIADNRPGAVVSGQVDGFMIWLQPANKENSTPSNRAE